MDKRGKLCGGGYIKITPIDIGGYLIDNFFTVDNRGGFTKLFEYVFFAKQGIVFHCSESFVSRSDKNVVRGMHFQTFHPQTKLVSVISGEIYDVIIDLQKESKTYGQWRGFYFSSKNRLRTGIASFAITYFNDTKCTTFISREVCAA